MKKIFALLMVAAISISFAACGGDADDNTVTDETTAAETTAAETTAAETTAEETTAAETEPEIEVVFGKDQAVKMITGSGPAESEGSVRRVTLYIDANDKIVAGEEHFEFTTVEDYNAKVHFLGYSPESYKITKEDASGFVVEMEYLDQVLGNYKKISYTDAITYMFVGIEFGETTDVK